MVFIRRTVCGFTMTEREKRARASAQTPSLSMSYHETSHRPLGLCGSDSAWSCLACPWGVQTACLTTDSPSPVRCSRGCNTPGALAAAPGLAPPHAWRPPHGMVRGGGIW